MSSFRGCYRAAPPNSIGPAITGIVPSRPPPYQRRLRAPAVSASSSPRGFWLLFYFGQSTSRSTPGVMLPELTTAFSLKTLDISSLIEWFRANYVILDGIGLGPREAHDEFTWEWMAPRCAATAHRALYGQCRDKAGRGASPTAAIIASQSVKSAEKAGVRTGTAMTRASKSRARNATSWSTRRVC